MSRPSNGQSRPAHDQWDELAVGYALTALEPDEMERFIEHLVAFCPQCQQSVDDTAGVGAGLGSALSMPVPAPSDTLRESVLRAAFAARPPLPQTTADLDHLAPVTALPRRTQPAFDAIVAASAESDRQVPDTDVRDADGPDVNGTNVADLPVRAQPGVGTPGERAADAQPPRFRASGAHRVTGLSERRARRQGRPAGWLVAAAAAVVAVVMTVSAVMSMQSRSRAAADASRYQTAVTTALGSSGQVVALRDNAGTDVASVVAHASSVSVVSLKMTPNSKTTSYVLWGINGKTANPVPLGVFDVATGKVQTKQVATDPHGYGGFTSYAVSHEAGHTAPATPTSIVATGTT